MSSTISKRLWTAALSGLAAIGTAGAFAHAQLPSSQPVLKIPQPTVIPTDAGPQAGMGDQEKRDAEIAFAQRMAQAAYDVAQGDKTARDPIAWRQAAAYLQAARLLDPAEPRYPRLQAEAYWQVGDADAAAQSLEAYLQLNRDDDIGRLKLIEYYVAKMQTVDAKLNYLQSLLDKPTVSNELKSRCATWAAVLLGERSLKQQVEMTDKAIELDPLNIYARRLEYQQLVSAGATPQDRLKSLVAQLRCNPAQTDILATMGRELAAAAMTREAVDWMAASVNLSGRAGTPIDPRFFVEYAAQLYLNGFADKADETVGFVLESDPTNLDAWFLRLTLRKAAGLQVALEQDLERAKRNFQGRAGALAQRILSEGNPGASTQPSANPATDIDFGSSFSRDGAVAGGNATPGAVNVAAPTGQRLADTVAKLKAPEAPAFFKSEFISALTDLAWFELYYNRSAASAKPWIDAVAELLPPTDVTVVRLRGWFELLENRQAEAMKILWTIRDRDALANMGVVRLLGERNWAPTKPGATATEKPASLDPIKSGQALLDKYPNGLIGAILKAEFQEKKLAASPGAFGAEMKKIAETFPIDLIRIVDQAKNFYAPIGAATKLPYRLGEPMLANITLRNLSEYDLPIGPDGIIKPDLWFDARVTLGNEQLFPMAAHDKISGPLVLKAKSGSSQIVRVDQGELVTALRGRPAASVDVFMTVMTNPMITQNYRVVAGPGGVRQQFARSLIRGGMPIFDEPQRKKLLEGLTRLPSDKMWTLDTLSAIVEQSRGPDADPNAQSSARDFQEQIRLMQSDRVPQVSAWASMLYMRLVDPAQTAEKVKVVEELSKSSSWEGRLSAIWAARSLPVADRLRIAKALTSDTNELVKTAAMTEAVLADRASRAGPATKPATQMAPVPGSDEGPALPSSPGAPSLPLPGQ